MSDSSSANGRIWVDADACPGVIKEILFRAAERVKIPLTLVANHWLRIPPSPVIRFLQVPPGLDVADSAIVERVAAGDLVVTQDIPLAALVLARQAVALNPRGQLYTPDNMAERDAELHGGVARRRRADRRPATTGPARTAGIRRRTGPLAGEAFSALNHGRGMRAGLVVPAAGRPCRALRHGRCPGPSGLRAAGRC